MNLKLMLAEAEGSWFELSVLPTLCNGSPAFPGPSLRPEVNSSELRAKWALVQLHATTLVTAIVE